MPSSPAVVVLGSLHYDFIIHGPRRPRKGETVTGTAWAPKCGGKGGNQAVSAARAGAPVRMIGAVGTDEFGTALLGNLAARGVDASKVAVLDHQKSGMSVAIFDSEGDYGAVIVSGANLAIDLSQLNIDPSDWHASNWLVLQSEIPESVNLAGARRTRSAGGKIILNAAPARPVSQALLDLVDILVVNAIEAEVLNGTAAVETLTGAMSAAEKLLDRCTAVVVTAGGEGCAYANRLGERVSLPAEEVKVESTHGAGDEFIGALAAALFARLPMQKALEAANRAAALLVSTPEPRR
jgi:ribokinase